MVRRGGFGFVVKLEKSPQKKRKKRSLNGENGLKIQLHGRCSVCRAVTSCTPQADRGVVQFKEGSPSIKIVRLEIQPQASRVNEQEKLNSTFFS